MTISLRCALGILILAAACKRSEPEAPAAKAPDPRIQVAQAALGPLKKNLKQTLMQSVADKGAVGAIDVCKIEAPKLAEAASTAKVKIGRTALKLRNPDNAPEAWMKPLLEELAKAPMSAGAHRTVELENGALGYMEPIYTAGVCLVCHGAAVAPDVAAAIDAAYPNDQAKGFEADQFRGAFWAVVEK